MNRENCECSCDCGCGCGCDCKCRGNSGAKNVLLFLGGALVGAALGVLFAPCDGRHTRQRIGKSATDLKDKAVHKFNDFADSAGDAVADLKNVAGNLKNSVTEKIEKYKTSHKSNAPES